jgi:excisionase family DNA binding protein
MPRRTATRKIAPPPRRRAPRRRRVEPAKPAADGAALTVPEVAAVLRCSESKAWRLVWDGRLASFKIGRLVRVSRAQLDAFMANGGAPGDDDDGKAPPKRKAS